MSADNAQRLVKALKDDPSLLGRLSQAGASGFQKVASEAGYDTTPQELAAALNNSVVSSVRNNETAFTAASSIISII